MSATGAAAAATCEACNTSFSRRTCERLCPECCAPLRSLRQRSGLSQGELASRVGCRRNTILDLERDRFYPALVLAERIAIEFGVEVLEAFPDLQITKAETQRVLHMTGRDVATLCDRGELPSTCEGHWHRVDYAAVLRLAAEREELRTEWISFHAAEQEYDLPWWLLAQLEKDGKLDVRIGDRRRTRLVRRSQLELVRQELIDNRKRVHCPHCRRWPKLGRKAHAKCLGPLGSHVYWLDPETRQLRRREHGELVRARLLLRPVGAVAEWYRHRFSAEPGKRLVSRWHGKRGGRRRNSMRDDYPQIETKINELQTANPRLGERELARRATRALSSAGVELETEVTRHLVREVLGRR